MRADEFVVERLIQTEKKVSDLEEVVEDLNEMLAIKRGELIEYQNLVEILKKRFKQDKYGISIELKNYIEDDKEDIEFVKAFLETDKEESAENG